MARSAEELKQLSIKEFTEAAKVYGSGHAGIYEMCKDDYPRGTHLSPPPMSGFSHLSLSPMTRCRT